MASSELKSSSDYVNHHLLHLNNVGEVQTKLIDLNFINLDTVFWGLFTGLITVFILWLAARKATSGIPNRFQAGVEIIVEMVEEQSKSIVNGNRQFIAPLALTVFLWIFFMNALDLLPVDLPHFVFNAVGLGEIIHNHRIVPTADLNGTMGLALGVFILMIYYNLKIKGLIGFTKELLFAPFGSHPSLWVFNLGLNIGAFCVFWGYKAKMCYAYEPELENYKIAVENIGINKIKNCFLFNSAVVGSNKKEINFFVGMGERKDGHSVLPFKGRKKVSVKAENINDILEKTKANKIKIDIEGAEYEVIKAIKNWSQIDAIIFEWHKSFLKDENNIKLKEIEKIIKSNFRETKGNFNTKGWMNIISAKK